MNDISKIFYIIIYTFCCDLVSDTTMTDIKSIDNSDPMTDVESMVNSESFSSEIYIESDLDPCMSGASTDLNDDTLVLSDDVGVNLDFSCGMSTPGRDLPGEGLKFVLVD